jgi:hypothetical protein
MVALPAAFAAGRTEFGLRPAATQNIGGDAENSVAAVFFSPSSKSQGKQVKPSDKGQGAPASAI